MRWQRLFDDLEARLDAADAAELSAEVAERTRRETALLSLGDRLEAAQGAHVQVHVDVGAPGGGQVLGRLAAAGPDWLLVTEVTGAEVLVPLGAVLGVTGVGARTAPPGAAGEVARRLDLRWALRGLARSRAGASLWLRDGSWLSGTLDRVGLDHVDLAEHLPGEARRAGAVRSVRLVPLSGLAAVRSG